MATVTLKGTPTGTLATGSTVKGSALTHIELDDNFNKINLYKLEITDTTGSAKVPSGTTANRDVAPSAGYLRFNSSNSKFEGYYGSAWNNFGGEISLANDISSSSDHFISFATANTSALTALKSSTALTFKPSTGTLTSTNLAATAGLSSVNLTATGTLSVTGSSTSTINRLQSTDITVANLAVTNTIGVSGTSASTINILNSTTLTATNITATSIIADVVAATDFNSTSDANLKTNITPISGANNILSKLNAVSFNWIQTGNKSYGVIAQEIQKILPELVVENEGTLSVSYIPLIALLIQAVKEQNEVITKLKNRVDQIDFYE